MMYIIGDANMHIKKLFYSIGELASLFGMTVPAIQAHLSRKNFEAIPPPIRLGKRLAWPVEGVEQWFSQKLSQEHFYSALQRENSSSDFRVKRKRGRPRKAAS